MRTKQSFRFIQFVVVVTLTLVAIGFANAHDGDKHPSDESVPIASPEVMIKEIESRHNELSEAVKAKHLEQVHELAFAIRDGARRLAELTTNDKRVRVEGIVANIAKITERLDQSGDAGDQQETEAHLRKLDTLLKLLSDQTTQSAKS